MKTTKTGDNRVLHEFKYWSLLTHRLHNLLNLFTSLLAITCIMVLYRICDLIRLQISFCLCPVSLSERRQKSSLLYP